MTGAETPSMTPKSGVMILAGPLVSHEHFVVRIVGAAEMESVLESSATAGLAYGNRVRIVPCRTMQEVRAEGERGKTMLRTGSLSPPTAGRAGPIPAPGGRGS